jgi:hypothetical protein
MILSMDLIGREPKLNIMGQQRYQTYTGAIFSLLLYVTSTVLGIYFLFKLFERSSFSIVSIPSISSYPIVNMTNIPFAIGLVDSGEVSIPKKGLWNVYAVYFNTTPVNDSNGNIKYINIKNQIIMEPCDINNHFGEFSDLFKNIGNIKDYFCMPRNLSLLLNGEDGSTTKSKTKFNIFINQCMNTTEINYCLPQEQIDSKLLNVYVRLNMIDFYLDHYNYTNPVQPYIYGIRTQISSTVYTKNFVKKLAASYYSDNGIILEQFYKKDFTQTDEYNLVALGSIFGKTTSSNSTNIAQFVVTASQNTYDCRRSYVKLQNILANIGGIYNSLLFMLNFALLTLTKNQYLNDIMNSISNLQLYYQENELIKKQPSITNLNM